MIQIQVRKEDIDALEKWFTKGKPEWASRMIKARNEQLERESHE